MSKPSAAGRSRPKAGRQSTTTSTATARWPEPPPATPSAGSSARNDGTAALLVSLAWPWDEQWWKPTTVRRDMVKACALALAEIERLDRTAPVQGSTCCKGDA
ncbi:hypothetical protein ACPA9J_29995 [Pseudomonas aeruginosa]